MATIAVPDELDYSSAEMDHISNVAVNIDRLGGRQVVASAGSLWYIKINFPIMEEEEIRSWRAFLMAQAGGIHNFLFGPPGYVGPSVYSGPQPLVMGAGQTGVTLVCDGVTPSTTILKNGEYFSLPNNELKVQTGGDAVSNVSGQVTFTFEPMIRTSPADNAAIEIDAPKAKFALVDPRVGFNYDIPSLINPKPLIAIEDLS